MIIKYNVNRRFRIEMCTQIAARNQGRWRTHGRNGRNGRRKIFKN